MRTVGGKAVSRSAWLLGVVLFFGTAYFYQDPEWNGNSRLNLTRAVVEQGRLEIDDFHEAPGWATGDKAFYNGHYYSDKAIGASLLAVPVHLVAVRISRILGLELQGATVKHVLTTAVMGTMFVLCGLSMYSIALRITSRIWKSALATIAVAFGTMLWPYSAVFYGHLPAAAFLVSTMALLQRAGESETHGSKSGWFWTGACASMAFMSDYTSAPVIVGLAIYALYAVHHVPIIGKIQTAWTAIPGLVLPLIVLFTYNMAIYGKPLAFGYAYEVEERFQEIMGLGLMGMRLPTLGATYHISFDPRFGLFWLSPILLLSPMGYFVAFRSRWYRPEALLSMFGIAVVFLMNAASFLWYGGSAFGPRLLISALPFFIVPLSLLPDSWAWPVGVLGAFSAGNMLIPLLGQIQYSFLEFKPAKGGFFVAGAPFHGFSLLYEYGLPEIRRLALAGKSPWNLGSALGLSLEASVAGLCGVEAVLVGTLHRLATGSKSVN